MATEKHHCMAVFKSDHFGAADLEEYIEEGNLPIFKITHVRQEYGIKVAGKKGDHNVAYFENHKKPWVVNSTNTKQLRKFQGGAPMVEDWQPMLVELYVDDNVKAVSGGITQGVRIRPVQPVQIQKPKPFFAEVNFEPAKVANATMEMILAAYQITPEMEAKWLEYVKK